MTADLLLTDSTTGKKDVFRPADPTAIGMYVCGPTVYDRAHIGNARSAVVFDLIYRMLSRVFGSDAVTYARNFTDIDDKIINRAADIHPELPPLQAISQLTRETTRLYHEDMDALGVLRPTQEPRATAYVSEMIADIEVMIAKGGAYEVEEHVFFNSEANQHRGTLSGRHDLSDDTVHRVEPHPLKRHPADFVLWKPSASDQPGWESPWGTGRPGWHIECSAMSTRLLGASFDIHGGGSDLMFPHHDNEISQARCCDPKANYARTWLHNGMITVAGQKMSKSIGNVITVGDLRERLPGGAIRLALLAAHYRNSLDWTHDLESQILSAWRKFGELASEGAEGAQVPQSVMDALLDDANTPKAIAALHALADAQDKDGLRASLELLGVSILDDRSALPVPLVKKIDKLVADRNTARANRDFAQADEIRDTLSKFGVMIMDKGQETTWEVTPEFDLRTISENL